MERRDERVNSTDVRGKKTGTDFLNDGASNHAHQHDTDGCCDDHAHSKNKSSNPGAGNTSHDEQEHDNGDGHNHDDHDHGHGGNAGAGGLALLTSPWVSASISFVMLAAGLALDHLIKPSWFYGNIRFIWFGIAYLPVGLPILIRGIKLAFRGELFTEFLLMSLATIGAFYLGEYPEGVAVMVFYAIGELFQDAAVSKAKRSIKALLDVRPDVAVVLRGGEYISVDPLTVEVGEAIRIKPGDRVPLDGVMLSEGSSFNTSALTGESKPSFIEQNGNVLAGMINEDRLVDLRVTRKFNESSLARILTLVQNAQGRKAKTELFIRKFARVYTPIVVACAAALTLLPYFFVQEYVFQDWLYRALIFLVISCPCALVVAIPLGYFGGIGAGSRNGILIKGSSYLDRLTRIGTVVMDKTGTLTKGVFKVQQVVSAGNDRTWLQLAASIESHSTHPVANAVVSYAKENESYQQASDLKDFTEVRGRGLSAIVDGKRVLVGNSTLMKEFKVPIGQQVSEATDTIVIVSVDGQYAGHLLIADEIKPDAANAISQLHDMGITTVMLSGDKQAVVDKVATQLGISKAHGDLLPEGKVKEIESLMKGAPKALAFVGDGINDAPVLALSDVGMAMGGLGSEAAIETADVVIQTDQPSKIAMAIRIGKATNRIVWQNIGLAFGVKVLVMAAGAWGVASMWEAVFADVGVALLAIVNAVRIQRMKFE
ncbi:heavy metal translocating P-type ATPase [Chryseolinea sp. T2]|uniref:heavy metal translocating P-type ATPase n=1 Tax=Chryseolinea sp. T2 TaxID=3129255 RepID=UPI003077D2E7